MGKYRIWFILLSAVLWSLALWGISHIKPKMLADLLDNVKVITAKQEPPPPPPPPPPPKPEVPPPQKLQERETKVIANVQVTDVVEHQVVKETPPTTAPVQQTYTPPPPPPPPPATCSERDSGPTPTRAFNIERAYPQRALDQELEGTVRATLQIDANGNVAGVSVNSSSNSVFDSAVMREAPRMKYRPARRNCENVASSVPLTVKFTLE